MTQPLAKEKPNRPQLLKKQPEPVPAPPDPGDGTRQLLQSGIYTLVAGILSALLVRFAFGGIGRQGPHTNVGWLLLIVAMNCLPFGVLLTLLGLAKWMRNRWLVKDEASR